MAIFVFVEMNRFLQRRFVDLQYLLSYSMLSLQIKQFQNESKAGLSFYII